MTKRWWIIGFGLALLIAVLSPLASPHPDGLERVAEEQGFNNDAQDPWYELIPDYLFPGVNSEAAATIIAGILGTLLMFALTLGLGRLLRKRSTAGS